MKLVQKTVEEPAEICQPEIVQQLSVSRPLFQIGFKEEPLSGYEWLKAQLECEILLDMLAGEGSPLYRRLYDGGLIHQDFGTEVFSGRGYFANIFAGESDDPRRVAEELRREITDRREHGLSEQDFLGCRKALYGRIVRGFNRVDNVANALVSSYFAGIDLYDNIRAVEEITFRSIKARFDKTLDLSKMAVSIVEPMGA